MESIYNSLVTLRIGKKRRLYDPVGHTMYKYAGSVGKFVEKNTKSLPVSPAIEPYLDQMTRAVYRQHVKQKVAPKRLSKRTYKKFVRKIKAFLRMVDQAWTSTEKRDHIRSMFRYFSRRKVTLLACPKVLRQVIMKAFEFARADWHEPLQWVISELSIHFYPCSGVCVSIKRKGRHVHQHCCGSVAEDRVASIASKVTHTGECCVCLESQKTDVEKSKWFATTCGHLMCDDCAQTWAVRGTGNGCPMCRNRK